MRAFSQERPIPRACRGCLTPSPHVTGVLTLSLARNDPFALVLGTSHLLCIALHCIASFCVVLHVFHAFPWFSLSPDLIDTVVTLIYLIFFFSFLFPFFKCFRVKSSFSDIAANSEPDSDRCTRALAVYVDDLNTGITTITLYYIG